MTKEKLQAALDEAERFVRRADVLMGKATRAKWLPHDPFWACPEQAACRRASLDLTKALSALRKSGYARPDEL